MLSHLDESHESIATRTHDLNERDPPALLTFAPREPCDGPFETDRSNVERSRELSELFRSERSCWIRLEHAIRQAINQSFCHGHFRPLVVESRVKEIDSLRAKVDRSGYRDLREIDDLLGFRIVTLFADEVDVAGRIVDIAFQVDPLRSVDKRVTKGRSSHGYSSLHKICIAPGPVSGCEPLRGRRFEIQIRSAVQHVWSEAEHDVVYKAPRVRNESRHAFRQLATDLHRLECRIADLRSHDLPRS